MSKDRARSLLALNMKRIREARGITGDELAEKAGLTGGYIRQIETLKSWVSSRTLIAIAKALRVPIEDLFRERGRT